MFHVIYTKHTRFGYVTRVKTIRTGIEGVRKFVTTRCAPETHVIVKYARTGQVVSVWA